MIRSMFALLAVSALLFGGCSFHQTTVTSPEKTVTAKVKKTFPSASVSAPQKIKRGGKIYYSYEVRQGKSRRSFTYTQSGTPVEKRVGITPSALPKRIKTRLQKLYPDAAVLAAQKTVKGKKTTYYVALKIEGRRFEVMLDMFGRRALLKA